MNFEEFKTELHSLKKEKKQEKLTKSEIYALRKKFLEEGKECGKCQRKENLTVDHIVPVSLLEQLGIYIDQDPNECENWQILCFPCNQYKKGRLDFTNLKTKSLLLKYINKL